jgi:hypothetical protein
MWRRFEHNNMIFKNTLSLLLLAQTVVLVSIAKWISRLEKRVQNKLTVIKRVSFFLIRG